MIAPEAQAELRGGLEMAAVLRNRVIATRDRSARRAREPPVADPRGSQGLFHVELGKGFNQLERLRCVLGFAFRQADHPAMLVKRGVGGKLMNEGTGLGQCDGARRSFIGGGKVQLHAVAVQVQLLVDERVERGVDTGRIGAEPEHLFAAGVPAGRGFQQQAFVHGANLRVGKRRKIAHGKGESGLDVSVM